MFYLKFFASSFLFLILLVSCSNEPESNPVLSVYKGTIKGFVYDATTNAPIYYAKITTSPKTIEVYTGADGDFILKDIMAGDYVVTAYLEGYDDDTASVTLKDKDTINTTFSLQDFSIYLEYYPLAVGDYWEYWSGYSPTYSIEIVSDTIINNLLYYVSVYKVLQIGNYSEFRYERLDTYNALAYRIFPYEQDEVIIDSLPAKADQIFTSYMLIDWGGLVYCQSIEMEEIFGELRSVRNLAYLGHEVPYYKIVKGIGLYSFGRFLGENTLKYAIINGVEYGER